MAERRPYQDRWRDGVLVEKGRRECGGRFLAIAGHVGEVATVVDVGGWDGYFSRRFAEAGAAATLIEPRRVTDLPAEVTHRQERVDASTVFPPVDVALALAVLHHMGDWEVVYGNLRRSCDVLVVEAAHPDELLGDLSPTLVETGDRIGPIYERVMRDGVEIADTPGPNGIRRPIVAIGNRVIGEVEDGLGRATEIMTNRPDGFWTPLDYCPHPGTLNVRVGAAGKRWVRNLPDPVLLDDEDGGPAGPYWPVTVDGIDGHVRCSKSRTTVEVVAPVRLRDVLPCDEPVTLRVR